MMNLDKTVHEMKSLGGFLADFSFPSVSSKDEDDISILKTRDVVVDGYEVVLHYGKQKFENGKSTECLQVLARRAVFLPFYVVSKLVQRFLGRQHLYFIDIYVNNKKVYCWTLSRDASGKVISTDQEVVKELDFEGLKFSYLNPATVNFL